MEITREMIEQVINATGADYNAAKQALTEHEGNVAEAVTAIKAKADAEAAFAEEAAAGEAAVEEAAAEEAAVEEAAAEAAAEEAAVEEAAEEAAEEDAVAGQAGAKENDESSDKGADGEAADTDDNKKEDPFEEFFSDADDYANKMAETLKQRVKEGNVKRIVISRYGRKILDIPVAAGIIGGFVGMMTIPWTMIIGALVAYGMNCKVEIVSDKGKNEEITVIRK